VHLGPLDLARYESFLPGSPALPVLRDWVRQYVGLARVWDVRLSLARAEVPAARLGATRLGWTSWLGGATLRGTARQARADLTFSPESLLLRQPRAAH